MRARKRLNLFILNEYMDHIIGTITKSLKNSRVFIDGVTKTVKHVTK